MSLPLVALIIGAGPRIGAAVVDSFLNKGYKVATVSRNKLSTPGVFSLALDITNTDAIPGLFESVKKEFGAAPSVIVLNAAGFTIPPNDNLFGLTSEQMVHDFTINTVAPYIAAGEAIKGWKTLPEETKKTFIFTGNALNTITIPLPMMLGVGVGKSASAYVFGSAAQLYEKEGYEFYYAAERKPDGQNAGYDLDGPAHGDFYTQLADHPAGVPWHATFVKGKGYVAF